MNDVTNRLNNLKLSRFSEQDVADAGGKESHPLTLKELPTELALGVSSMEVSLCQQPAVEDIFNMCKANHSLVSSLATTIRIFKG